MVPSINNFEIITNDITAEQIALAQKYCPEKFMQVEECLRQSPIRAFRARFEVDFVSSAPFYFEELKRKWPNKKIKKYLKNYDAVKGWIAQFELKDQNCPDTYHFVFAFYYMDELKVMRCNWGPIDRTHLNEGQNWYKQTLKTGKQITIMVNPKDPTDVAILGQLAIYIIVDDKIDWLAETDWTNQK